MAIAFDSVTTSLATTFAHTCTGTELTLFVGIKHTGTVTGVTYNSVAMTQMATVAVGDIGENVDVWYLINPSTGSNNVVMTGGASHDSRAVSYTGTNQSAQPDASGTASVSAAAPTVSKSISVVASNCWFGAFMRNEVDFSDSDTGSVAATRRGTDSSIAYFDSNGTIGTGSQSGNYKTRGAGNADWGLIVWSIAPPSVATTNSNFFALM